MKDPVEPLLVPMYPVVPVVAPKVVVDVAWDTREAVPDVPK